MGNLVHTFLDYIPVQKPIIILPESPIQFILRSPTGSDVDCEKELFEIYEPIFILIKSSKHMITELFRISSEKTISVDVHERVWCQLSIRAVLLEPLVPLNDGVHTVVGVGSQVLQVLLGQFFTFLWCFRPHCVSVTVWDTDHCQDAYYMLQCGQILTCPLFPFL